MSPAQAEAKLNIVSSKDEDVKSERVPGGARTVGIVGRGRQMIASWKAKMFDAKRTLEMYIDDPHVVSLFLLVAYTDILLESLVLSGSSLGAAIDGLREAFLLAQLFELLIQLAIFNVRFFGHWGYALDTVLVTTRLLNNGGFLATDKQHLHCLSFLRVWRFVRVVQSFIANEVSDHNRTKADFASQIKSANKWKKKAEDAERETRQFKAAKEEIVMLREALNIAALDVAAALNGKVGSTASDGTDNEENSISVPRETLTEDETGVE
ncbi:hypothetical protein ACHAWF_012546 [Thalassiosira exigua]